MNATAEIDKSGRLVVPKKFRDALHLSPGTRLTVRQENGELVLARESKPRGLHIKNGLLVFETGKVLPADHINWVDQDREDRAGELERR